MATKDPTIIVTDDNFKNKIKFKEISYDTNEKYKYIDSNSCHIDKVIRDIVYHKLNSNIDLNELKILFINECKNPESYKLFTYKDVDEIYKSVLSRFPSIISLYGVERVQLAILFYINRFIYQLFDYFNNKNRRLKKRIILYYAYNHVFKVLKEIKGFLMRQIGHLMSFISPNISQIYELLYKYTDIDEDKLILTCINRYICNVSYKYNPFRISNLEAFVKLIFKQIISMLLKVNINEDDEYRETSTKYTVISSSDQLNNNALVNKYEFLIDILKSLVYGSHIELSFNDDIIYHTVDENYKNFSNNINPFRLLYFIYKNSFDGSNYSLYLGMYDDLMEIFNIVTDNNVKSELKKQFPTLYRLIKSFTIHVGAKNNNLRIRFPIRTFKQLMITELKTKYWNIFDDKTIEFFINDLATTTNTFFRSNIFLDPLTLVPVTKIKYNDLVKDIVKFYSKFFG